MSSSVLTYEDVITPMTIEQARRALVLALQVSGIDTDSWGETDEPRATLEYEAEQLVGLSQQIASIGKLAVLRRSTGAGLTLNAKEWFGIERRGAVQTRGVATFTNTSGAPMPFAEQELVIVSKADPDRILFRNVDAFTLGPGSSLTVWLGAVSPGQDWNVGAATLYIGTPLPGLSMSLASSWITQSGANEEDDAPLIRRCETKQAGNSVTGPEESYVQWALDAAAPSINRARVVTSPTNVPPLPAVYVYLASLSGGAPPDAVTLANANIQKRVPSGTLVEVASADPSANFELRGNAGVKAGFVDAARTKISSLVNAWFAGTLVTVNGEIVDGLQIGGRMRVMQLIELIMSVPGVVTLDLFKTDGVTRLVPGTDDVIALANQVITLTYLLKVVAV